MTLSSGNAAMQSSDDDNDEATNANNREKNAIFKKTRVIGKQIKPNKTIGSLDTSSADSLSPSNQGNRTGNNVQIQLW